MSEKREPSRVVSLSAGMRLWNAEPSRPTGVRGRRKEEGKKGGRRE